MKPNFLSLRAIVFVILVALFTQSGCHENTVINSRVSPSNNAIGVYDTTLPVITHTYFDDSAITSTNIGGISNYEAVGAITDPYFGTMTASTYFQVIWTTPSATLYAGDSIDSAILILPYSGFTYGDTSNTSLTQTYQVFYMTDSIGYYSTYYSYNTKGIDQLNPLSDPYTVNIYHLQDSLGINVLPVNHPGLRIKLRLPQLLSRLLPAQNIFATSSDPAQDWINAFNGICVQVADTRKTTTAIPYFQLDGTDPYSEACIIVFYHPDGYPGDTLSEPYYFNTGSCAHFNSITRSYSHYPVNNLINSKAANDPVIALQNQPGASLDVIIPGIKSLPAGIINKAELQLTLLPGSEYYNFGIYAYPERLYPIGIGNGNYPAGVSAGETYNLADRYPLTSVTPLGVMDGYMHTFTTNGVTLSTFTVDLPREIMASIAAKNDTIHMHINGTEDFYGAFHMVAGGGNYGVNGTSDTLYRAKLNVVYSKLTNK